MSRRLRNVAANKRQDSSLARFYWPLVDVSDLDGPAAAIDGSGYGELSAPGRQLVVADNFRAVVDLDFANQRVGVPAVFSREPHEPILRALVNLLAVGWQRDDGAVRVGDAQGCVVHHNSELFGDVGYLCAHVIQDRLLASVVLGLRGLATVATAATASATTHSPAKASTTPASLAARIRLGGGALGARLVAQVSVQHPNTAKRLVRNAPRRRRL
jgi:hypothetical protein